MKINHILIQTSNLSAMTTFFEKVAGLKKGARPPFPFPGEWMYSADKPIIHLVEAQSNSSQSEYLGTRQLNSGGAIDHIAFEGSDYKALIETLSLNQISYTERTVPSSQEHQVFVSGPDGVKLEILFDHNKQTLTFS